MFESQPRHTEVVKTGSYSSTAKRSAIGVSVTGPRSDHYKRMPRVKVGEYKLSSTLSIYSTLIAIVGRDYDAAYFFVYFRFIYSMKGLLIYKYEPF